MPSFCPRRIRGLDSTRRRTSAAGRLPSMTMPMPDTVIIASSIGARFGMSATPAMYCTAPAVNPMMDSQRSSAAKAENARMDCAAKNLSPSIRRSEKSATGSVWMSSGRRAMPLTAPPSSSAMGNVPSPIRRPR